MNERGKASVAHTKKVAETKWKLVWRSNDAMGWGIVLPSHWPLALPLTLFIVALQRGRTEEQESLKRLSRLDPQRTTANPPRSAEELCPSEILMSDVT